MTGQSITLGVAGSGTIACGLAATAAAAGLPVVLLARSRESAARAYERCGGGVRTTVTAADLAACDVVVEAVTEDPGVKVPLLLTLDAVLGPQAILATTTSSLSVEALATACGRPDRFVALHVFNPVQKMALVELAFPSDAGEPTRAAARGLVEALGKTPVVVPDVPGFVVNRLLFPYLFAAVTLADEQGIAPRDVDTCMKLGAGMPMGPHALLDFVGLDVALAIGESLGVAVPQRIRDLVAEGATGRKAGRGLVTRPTP